mmetsp:Transcript_51566/g.136915  ORF Transcript_51566/g.136915 Transcript_51566/m.136915 type:complete len:90 (-) Transcript_51566:1941-2210(-)
MDDREGGGLGGGEKEEEEEEEGGRPSGPGRTTRLAAKEGIPRPSARTAQPPGTGCTSVASLPSLALRGSSSTRPPAMKASMAEVPHTAM